MIEETIIELRSESVQEILGHSPKWIIRWGISIIFIIVAGLVVGSYFFKYPDVLTATITVTTENLPAGVTAKTTGRIDTLFVIEKQNVKQGDLLAVIENPAEFEDVKELRDLVISFQLSVFSNEIQVTNQNNFLTTHYSLLTTQSHLGELQPAFNAFIKALEDYQYFIKSNYHNKKIATIKKQIHTQNIILSKSEIQLNLSSQQLEAAYLSTYGIWHGARANNKYIVGTCYNGK
jgi:HlyD family secretion protein